MHTPETADDTLDDSGWMFKGSLFGTNHVLCGAITYVQTSDGYELTGSRLPIPDNRAQFLNAASLKKLLPHGRTNATQYSNAVVNKTEFRIKRNIYDYFPFHCS
jgi:hypothetical protein